MRGVNRGIFLAGPVKRATCTDFSLLSATAFLGNLKDLCHEIYQIDSILGNCHQIE